MATVTPRILDPAGETRPLEMQLASRPGDLSGLVLGFLDNNKPNVGPLFDTLEEELCRRYGIAGVVRCQKPQAPEPVRQRVIQEFLDRCQAVVLAMAD